MITVCDECKKTKETHHGICLDCLAENLRGIEQPYRLEAIHLLGQGYIPVTDTDIDLLSADIVVVAQSLMPTDNPNTNAYRAAMELKKRIGGTHNLERYMKCLRIPDKH